MELKWPLGGVVFVALLVTGSNAQPDVCGFSPHNPRVEGGGNAPVGAWPWHVALVRRWLGSFDVHCGGSLINDQWILTASSCVHDLDASGLKVWLGADCLDEPSSVMVERQISTIIVHPLFKPQSVSHNIALLKMSSPVTFNKYISPVCLAKSGSIYEEGTSWVTGFGYAGTGDPNPYPRYLREVKVPIVPKSECVKEYPDIISANIICAGKDGKGVCDGDGGSPLVSKNTNEDKWVQAGVVTYDQGFCSSFTEWTDHYTRVSAYEDWIKSHIVTNQPGFITGAPMSAGTSLVSQPLLPLLLLLSSVLSYVV